MTTTTAPTFAPGQTITADALDAALAHVRAGGTLVIPTYGHCTVINARTLAKFDKAGAWLLRADGDGFRLRSGKGSVYLFPGQLRAA